MYIFVYIYVYIYICIYIYIYVYIYMNGNNNKGISILMLEYYATSSILIPLSPRAMVDLHGMSRVVNLASCPIGR